ncbi:MAG TPA: hypothetical protein ENG03_03790 [Thioploca sp.]|nr:MAG: hypothetical protein B6247_11865 [Beggiatoa sp. 4572_84]RKZ56270.1 MAG: hypothetical protein DRR08_22150 [Gammaproteobacteria bacterium]HDN26213.1 hypothetical protein [Thioploca sp.]
MKLLPVNWFIMVNFSLSLALGFTSAMAFESAKNVSVYSQNPSQPEKKKERRRRGDCDLLSVWTASLCDSNTFCYQAPEQLRLWLPKHKRSGQMNDRLVILNPATQTVVIKPWAASEHTFAWPFSNMPLQSGTHYRVGLKNGRHYSLIELTLHQIPAHLSVTEQIAAMRQLGCSQQANMLQKLGH